MPPTSITSFGNTGMMMPKPMASMKMVKTMNGMMWRERADANDVMTLS